MKKIKSTLQQKVLKVSKLHFLYAALIALQIIIYDAWELITPDSVLKRWLAVATLALVAIAVWYMSHSQSRKQASYTSLVWALILIDTIIAAYFIYLQRGMASKYVALFAIPILTAGVLLKRSAVFTAAALSIVAYVVTCVSYFVLNFNEGYKVELYGEIVFYSGVFMLVAALVWALTRDKNPNE
jgi:hypothetical protein